MKTQIRCFPELTVHTLRLSKHPGVVATFGIQIAKSMLDIQGFNLSRIGRDGDFRISCPTKVVKGEYFRAVEFAKGFSGLEKLLKKALLRALECKNIPMNFSIDLRPSLLSVPDVDTLEMFGAYWDNKTKGWVRVSAFQYGPFVVKSSLVLLKSRRIMFSDSFPESPFPYSIKAKGELKKAILIEASAMVESDLEEQRALRQAARDRRVKAEEIIFRVHGKLPEAAVDKVVNMNRYR
jgi:hypothetical protein